LLIEKLVGELTDHLAERRRSCPRPDFNKYGVFTVWT